MSLNSSNNVVKQKNITNYDYVKCSIVRRATKSEDSEPKKNNMRIQDQNFVPNFHTTVSTVGD